MTLSITAHVHYAECWYIECHNFICCYHAQCRYVECHYGECRGAKVATETDATSMTQNLSYKPFWGTQKPTGENLKVCWAEFSTLS